MKNVEIEGIVLKFKIAEYYRSKIPKRTKFKN